MLCEKTAPPVVRGSVASRRRAPSFRSFCPPDVLEHRPGHSKCTALHPVLTLWMCKLRPATSSSPGPLPALPGTAIHTLRPLPSLSQASAARAAQIFPELNSPGAASPAARAGLSEMLSPGPVSAYSLTAVGEPLGGGPVPCSAAPQPLPPSTVSPLSDQMLNVSPVTARRASGR